MDILGMSIHTYKVHHGMTRIHDSKRNIDTFYEHDRGIEDPVVLS